MTNHVLAYFIAKIQITDYRLKDIKNAAETCRI